MHEEETGLGSYAIANQKGGVGKTTIARALAGELGRRNVATLLIDLDPQASATNALGVDVERRPTMADVLLETCELVRAHYNPGLALAGVVVNRCERTVEHRVGTAEIERHFDAGIAWQPYFPKRTVLQDATRRAVPVHRIAGEAACEVANVVATLARRIEIADAVR